MRVIHRVGVPAVVLVNKIDRPVPTAWIYSTSSARSSGCG